MTTTDTIICPSCGQETESNGAYCTTCGKQLPKGTVIGNQNGEVDPGGKTEGLDSSTASSSSAENTSSAPASDASTAQPAPESPDVSPEPAFFTQEAEPQPVHPTSISMTKDEMRKILQKLQDPSIDIEHYFPVNLPGRKFKLEAWKQQITRAQHCLDLLDHPLLQEPELKQAFDQPHALAEAIDGLDFTREYTVKLIGPTGAGKSTLITPILGQDILPTGFGTAVTGVRVRILLCSQQKPEELRIQFLTRQEFDQLLSDTEREKNAEELEKKRQKQNITTGTIQAQKDEDGPFTKEWKRLTYLKNTPDKETGKTYVEMYLDESQPKTVSIPRDKWKTEGEKFITEPTGENIPYLVRLVDFAQFSLRADKDSLLPEGSVWVDLPGGSAGQVHHEAILKKELEHLDAVILIVGASRYDDEAARKIFEKVYDLIWRKQTPEVAARKIFIAATRWDEITTDKDRERAKAGMRTLVNKFPLSYQNYHLHEVDGESLPYYPLNAFDARIATLGLKGVQLDSDQKKEASKYKGHITTVYDKLLASNSSLPPTFTAQDFKDFPHQAMLDFSGVPKLTDVLRNFLAEQRYEVQLQQATEQLNQAFLQIEDGCWKYLTQQGFSSRDIQQLRQEKQRRDGERKFKRFERLQTQIGEMRNAWQKALIDYDIARDKTGPYNSFYQALKEAYDQAIEHMNQRIDQRDFDQYIDVANYISGVDAKFTWTISWKEKFTEIYGKNLRTALRSRLGSVLEQSMQGKPAQVLAEMFLSSVEKQGAGTGGKLDIERISFREEDAELEKIRILYEQLLEGIRATARAVCRYVTMSDFVSEKHELAKDHPHMIALYQLGDIVAKDARDRANEPGNTKTPEYILDAARTIMKKMAVALSEGLVESTYQRIAIIYRYELEKLERRTVYDMTSPASQPIIQPGDFQKLVSRLHHTLLSLLDTSPTLGAKIDGMTVTEVVDFDAWADFIGRVRKQKRSA